MGFLDELKKGVGKAGLEAEKTMRITRLDATIGSLGREKEKLLRKLGEEVYALYEPGETESAEWISTCQAIASLDEKIAEIEGEKEELRRGILPRGSGPLYGHICPRCRRRLPQEAAFCPDCGSPAEDVPPPSTATVAKCPDCGEAVPESAAACPNCGEQVSSLATEGSAPAGGCPGCGVELADEAEFCPSCGERLSGSEPEAAPDATECPHCGFGLREGSVFCSSCGESVA
ncbi:MAG TPA: zinc-ribbon domain-containing protein [Anaerolineae bacterium]|nr:zinc-ribbon domain-containing protein [Anaerolineae bacterium]